MTSADIRQIKLNYLQLNKRSSNAKIIPTQNGSQPFNQQPLSITDLKNDPSKLKQMQINANEYQSPLADGKSQKALVTSGNPQFTQTQKNSNQMRMLDTNIAAQGAYKTQDVKAHVNREQTEEDERDKTKKGQNG